MDKTEKPLSPFTAHPDWHNNACINNHMQFSELANNFLASADALIQCVIDESRTLDVHIYAICFLYRHACELLLKDLAWKSNYAATGQKDFPKVHILSQLWGEVSKLTRSLCGKDYPLTANETEAVKTAFANIEEHDPRSYSFRYPFSMTMERTHPTLTHVNVRALYEDIHRALDYIYRLYTPVDYIYEQRSDYEREMEAEARQAYEAENY